MNRKLLLVASLMLALLGITRHALAQSGGGQPTVPWTVYGTVTINGALATPGTLVEARNPSTNTQCGQTQVIAGGNYVVNVESAGQTPGCFNDNDAVQFRVMVNGVFQEAQQSPTGMLFQSGAVHTMDLSITIAPPAPCPDFSNPPGVWLEDVLTVAGHWRETNADPNWDPRLDLDGDGRITVQDVTMVTARWGDTCR